MDTVASAFLPTWGSRYGVLEDIVTDRGCYFESSPFRHLTRLLGTTRLRTAAYQPQENGLFERFHWRVKASLKAHEAPSL